MLIFFSLVFRKQKTEPPEGEIITLTDQKTISRPIHARIIVLPMLMLLEDYIRNNLLWFNIVDDQSIRDALNVHIVYYVFNTNITTSGNRTNHDSYGNFRVVTGEIGG